MRLPKLTNIGYRSRNHMNTSRLYLASGICTALLSVLDHSYGASCPPGSTLVCPNIDYADCYLQTFPAQVDAAYGVLRNRKPPTYDCITTSSFYVGGDLFVTADHAISSSQSALNQLSIEILSRGICSSGSVPESSKLLWSLTGIERVYNEYYTTPKLDLAFYRPISTSWTKPSILSDLDFVFSNPTEQMEIYGAGYPSLHKFRDSELHISERNSGAVVVIDEISNLKLTPSDRLSGDIQTTASVETGFSGSPIFQWSNQLVRGVMTGRSKVDCESSSGLGARHVLMHLQENGATIDPAWYVGTLPLVGDSHSEAYHFGVDGLGADPQIYQGTTTRFGNSRIANPGKDVWFKFDYAVDGDAFAISRRLRVETEFPAIVEVTHYDDSGNILFNTVAALDPGAPASGDLLATRFTPTYHYDESRWSLNEGQVIVTIDGVSSGDSGYYSIGYR